MGVWSIQYLKEETVMIMTSLRCRSFFKLCFISTGSTRHNNNIGMKQRESLMSKALNTVYVLYVVKCDIIVKKTSNHSLSKSPTCIQINHSLPSAVKSSHSELLRNVSSWEHAFGDVKFITETKVKTLKPQTASQLQPIQWTNPEQTDSLMGGWC